MGDEDASDELYDRYNGLVCRFTRHHLVRKGCNHPDDHGEDIIISAWLAIFEHLDQLRRPESIEPWINRIILNLVLAHVSGPKGCISDQRNRDSLEAVEEAGIESADNIYRDLVLVNEIMAQAEARSSKFAEVMWLYIEEGYTMEEIARHFGESPAKLWSMYYRNLHYLQELFNDTRDDDDDPSKH